MATRASHNKNSSAVKRIMTEARELQNDDSTEYVAAPLEEDIFEWHCTIRGPADTEFEGGLYHCRIILPAEYPFKAPSIMIMTPNGRFELNKKICISFTSYHEELWQPAWGIRTAIVGLQGFFPLKGEAAVGVGAVEYPIAERKRLAALSRCWACPDCGKSNVELLPDPSPKASGSTATTEDASPSISSGTVPLHTSLATASIPVTLPSLVSHPAQSMQNPTILRNVGPPSTFIDPVPDAATGAILPVATVPTTPPLQQILAEPAREHIVLQQAPAAVPMVVRSARRPRPPIWLDGLIVFFGIVFASVVGRRVSNLWEMVTEHA